MAIATLLLPWRVLAIEPLPYAGQHAFGFHEWESDPAGRFRWTQGRAAETISWPGETLVLVLANGHPRASERPVEVVVGVDGETVARFTVAAGWEAHPIELGERRRSSVLLTLEVSPTFRPFSDFRDEPGLEPSQDIRSLGVAMREALWE
jgi:hypothetical protein